VVKEGFWDNLSSANKTYQQLKSINKIIQEYNNLNDAVLIMLELLELDEVEKDDIDTLVKNVEELEINTLLSGPYDNSNCYLEIHPGAGGTESMDWASMLLRMYERFLEKNNFQYKVIDKQDGEEAGIKSVTILVEGDYAYGYLKNEKGVHRLVRISPFDSNKRRHTSFASVEVTPLLEQNSIDIEIKESDIRIDVYRSSGAGGQGVNTADSAVRITHIPTNIVVTCQNERSQIKNKEKAMDILKGKLYLLEKETVDKKLNELKGAVMDVNFGSQIRNYVMCPYSMVKDLRTLEETSDVNGVLDGNIDKFLESYLRS